MNLTEIQALEERYLMQTYARAPVEFVRGEGAVLWDAEGREYLDFLAGISVCSVGHCNPAVVEAIREQAGRLIHVSNLFYTEPMVRLAERLDESGLGGRVFFSNSGTEANECAIKIARKHAHGRGVEAPEIVSFERDFHGRTYGSLSATPKLAENPALGPMLPGFRLGAPERRGGAARGGRRAHRRRPDRADPGRERGLPGHRRGAGRRPRGLRRGRRPADLRRDPDRDGADRLALGLRAVAGAPGCDHDREGARRRPADRRLPDQRRRPARCSSPATTARPSPAGPLVARAALAVLDIVDDPALLRGGARARRGAARGPARAATGCARCAAAA